MWREPSRLVAGICAAPECRVFFHHRCRLGKRTPIDGRLLLVAQNLLWFVDVNFRSLPHRLPQVCLLLSGALSILTAFAEPVPAEAAKALLESPPSLRSEHPIDAEQWAREEANRSMMAVAETNHRELIRQGWQAPPPTWIQGSIVVNLGDLHTLDNAADKAERELQTLQWVIDDQQRQANVGGVRRGADMAAPDDKERWFGRLLPGAWIGTLKAQRDWVVAGGTTLLLIVWVASIFARRPGGHAEPTAAPPRPASKRRRRRRHKRNPLP